ncbi:hypothetical protein BGZ54_007576 [Gamsiella multidivaricata]|nr:hypothetical protein BGZ54_007576 [Gamsiella multidivaricata]
MPRLERNHLASHNRHKVHAFFYENDSSVWGDIRLYSQALLSSPTRSYNGKSAASEYHKCIGVIARSPDVPKDISNVSNELRQMRRTVLQRAFRRAEHDLWEVDSHTDLNDLVETEGIQDQVREKRKTVKDFYEGEESSGMGSADNDEADDTTEDTAEAAGAEETEKSDDEPLNVAVDSKGRMKVPVRTSRQQLGPFDPPPPSSDSSYSPGETPAETTEEFLSVGVQLDRLVGPGCKSSTLFCEHWRLDDFNISAILMKQRRAMVQNQASLKLSDEILQLNFVFTQGALAQCLPSHVIACLRAATLQESVIPPEFLTFCFAAISQPLSALDAEMILRNSILGRFLRTHLMSGQL